MVPLGSIVRLDSSAPVSCQILASSKPSWARSMIEPVTAPFVTFPKPGPRQPINPIDSRACTRGISQNFRNGPFGGRSQPMEWCFLTGDPSWLWVITF